MAPNPLLKGGLCVAAGVLLLAAQSQPPKILARALNSHSPHGSTSFNGISAASDGKIYYVLSSHEIEAAAQMYSYDPQTDQIRHLGDLSEAVGEKDLHAIPQGKSHVSFWEFRGKLYFATHLGYYEIKDGREMAPETPPPGYKAYAGGHFLSYDMASGKFEEIAKAPGGEGIIAMALDGPRGRLYGLTWPRGNFIRYDMASHSMKNLGAVSLDGEAGTGATYRAICRALVVNPDDGSVYLTTGDGAILRYRLAADAMEPVAGENLKKDYFGTYDPSSTGHMAYNWRQAVWNPREKAIYAVHGNSGYLFRFDPQIPQVDVLERITSEPSRHSGMFDKFYYGYLGFTLGPDGHTLYYLTGGPQLVNGKRVASSNGTKLGSRGAEDLHLVTYDISNGAYRDHGGIYFADGSSPSTVNSIAIGKDGSVYCTAGIREGGKQRTDLVRIPVK